MQPIDALALTRLATNIAAAAGVPTDDAFLLANSLVDADLSGTSTHGVSRLNIYVRRIQKGLIDPKAQIKIDRKRTGTLSIDANNGLGQVQASKTLDLLLPMARQSGVATATIRNSQHFGALSWYCNRCANEGMILIAMTSGEPSMSPEGGSEPFLGTNPIAASFPTGKGWPVKIDLATSLVARGNIIAAAKKGLPIPANWALDVDGNPTTDASKALLGTVLTMAGHKGFALALMVEVFSSVLSGAAIGPKIGSMYKHMDRKQDLGHFFCLLDIEAFMDLTEFKHRIDESIDTIKSGRKRPGVTEILVPGERSWRSIQEKRKTGLTIDPATWKEMDQLARELGVNV